MTDLDDFITPSQSCIKPVKLDNSNGKAVERLDIDNETGTYVQINKDGTSQKLEKTTISLADCLACSGCVTSAESVLVNQQSVDAFLKRLEEIAVHNAAHPKEKTMVIVSISPQSRASLAHRYEMDDPMEAMRRIVHFCKKELGASYVFDTTWSRHLALWDMCQEFVERYKQQQQQNGQKTDNGMQSSGKMLPLLTSACPGWICYAEKTQPGALPYVSKVKSPQQIMGTIVKDYFARKIARYDADDANNGDDNDDDSGGGGSRYSSFYHVTVMPCYDKKLEASREDFQASLFEGQQEVDLALTTTELEQLLHKKNYESLKDVPMEEYIDPLFNEVQIDPATGQQMLGNVDGLSGSGGYLEVVFRYAAAHLFGVDNVGEIKFKRGRNEDFQECWLEVDGEKVLHFAVAYGFRNIQNVVRRLNSKRRKLPYHFVEVMACPSGCLNGGGQLPAPKGTLRREFLDNVRRVYHNVPVKFTAPLVDKRGEGNDTPPLNSNGNAYDNNPSPGALLRSWLSDGNVRDAVLRTQYHKRDNLNINPLAIKW